MSSKVERVQLAKTKKADKGEHTKQTKQQKPKDCKRKRSVDEQRIEAEFKKFMEIMDEGYDPVPF